MIGREYQTHLEMNGRDIINSNCVKGRAERRQTKPLFLWKRGGGAYYSRAVLLELLDAEVFSAHEGLHLFPQSLRRSNGMDQKMGFSQGFPNDRETQKCRFQDKMTTRTVLLRYGPISDMQSFNWKKIAAFVPTTPFCANQTAMPGPPRFCHRFQHQLSLQSYI